MLREEEARSQGKTTIQANEVPIHPVRLCHEINEFLSARYGDYIGDGGAYRTFSGLPVQNRVVGWTPARSARRRGHWISAMVLKYAQPERDVVVLLGDVLFSLTGFDSHHDVGAPQSAVCGRDRQQPHGTRSAWGRNASTLGRGDIGTVARRGFDHLAEFAGTFIRGPSPRTPVPRSKRSLFRRPAPVDVVINRDVYFRRGLRTDDV
jgi:acetolactate synthase-1/2/3 large subunit